MHDAHMQVRSAWCCCCAAALTVACAAPSPEAAAPPWRTLALRYLAAGVSLAAFGLGWVWCLIDGERRAWHDLASHTVVVRLPKPPRRG